MTNVRQQNDGRSCRRSSGDLQSNNNRRKRLFGAGFVVLGEIGRHTGLGSHAAARAGNSRGLGAVAGRDLTARLAAIGDLGLRRKVFTTALFLSLRTAFAGQALASVEQSRSAESLRSQRQGGEPDQSGAKGLGTHHGNYHYVAQGGKFSRYNQRR